jgi:spore germination protein KB
MLEDSKISVHQFTILVTLHLTGTSILIIPSLLAAEAKQDAWIAALLALGIMLCIAALYVSLGNRFSGMNFAEYMEVILGKWAGKAVSIWFFIALPFFTSSLTLRNLGDFVTTQIMPETPIEATHIIFMGVVIMGLRLGLETLARAAELFFPWIILLFFVIIVFVTPEVKLENIQPVLEEGFKPVIRAAVTLISFPFIETVIFLMVFPYVNRSEKVGKAFYAGIATGGLFLFIVTVLSILVFGADLVARNNFPSYMLSRKISVGGFLERVEVMLAIIWFITIFFRLSIFQYVAAIGVAQILNLKEYRFLTIPMGMILIVLSLVAVPNTTYLMVFNQKTWPVYAATFGIFLPMLLLGLAVLRKKGSRP